MRCHIPGLSLTVSGLQAAFSCHTCATHLSPKAETVEACKERPGPQALRRQDCLWRGQVTELGQDSVVGVPYTQTLWAVLIGTTAIRETKAASHRHTGPGGRVCILQ